MSAISNARIADVFESIADLLEFQGANQFRVGAYRKGAKAVLELNETIAKIVEEGRDLAKIPGIGKSIAEKCHVLVETGTLPQFEELKEEVPMTVLDVMRVPGVGPKKAKALYDELGVRDLEMLRSVCEEKKVRELKGFAAKTEENILKNLPAAEHADKRVLWSEADAVATALKKYMSECKAIKQMEIAGSYRRGKETIGDLDLLVVADDVKQVMDHFDDFSDKDTVIGRGDTKMSVRLFTGLQIDLRVVPEESFGAALQYFTGSKEHNVIVRGIAKRRGLKINEYGVYKLDGDDQEWIAGKTEEDVYATLGLPLFPPQLRENRHEFDGEEAADWEGLISLDDIRGDLHMHTTATDGQNSLDEMAKAAEALGYEYISITDHSKRVSMARGLNEERLLAQWEEIDAWNKQHKKNKGKITVLKGIECDILEAGGMDLSDECLAQSDWVMASVHYGGNQSRDKITGRILEAMDHPNVSAISHPTGRLINTRPAYEVDLQKLYAHAVETGTFMEMNASAERLDLSDIEAAAAHEMGVLLVISTDAHRTDSLTNMRLGILQARRAGLKKDAIVNTRTLKQLLKLKK